jgi:hypothetical protein
MHSAEWNHALLDNLGEDYLPIAYLSLWQIRLGIYARKSLERFITNIEHDEVATGLGGVAGNKGGIGKRELFFVELQLIPLFFWTRRFVSIEGQLAVFCQ